MEINIVGNWRERLRKYIAEGFDAKALSDHLIIEAHYLDSLGWPLELAKHSLYFEIKFKCEIIHKTFKKGNYISRKYIYDVANKKAKIDLRKLPFTYKLILYDYASTRQKEKIMNELVTKERSIRTYYEVFLPAKERQKFKLIMAGC